ncbi:multiple ankyrin repeats single kh domain-containing [Trichoderma arundinaceum]|uniref:Multiple ankyrin repeats single kh domain-containing n=1 Tax=Trichoderma arundinaceum TaxID=490622 RepID=A0A395NKG0_TRIAR|nr:multiple ankyrin repeats single kh domain-containing [Trichoderma arundinaceum]
MGGLVVAKAITLADSRRDLFPIMFEATTACIFFGTPFSGAPIAAAAAMYAYFAEKVDMAFSSKLLDLMKPGDEELRQLTHDFMRLAGKISPKIELFCFWEEHPTDFSQIAGLPNLFGFAKSFVPKQYAEFVNRDSATLPGVEELGLACNHRDLVKFDGPKDDRWTQMVRDPVKKIIHGAQLAVRNRLNSVRDIDRAMISGIMDALDGAQIQKKRKALSQSFTPSSWIPQEAEYIEWLKHSGDNDKQGATQAVDCLYIRGREGRGKTNATMAALQGIERLISDNEESGLGHDPILLVYFFCDTATDYSTAEDVLKSIIRQLINQQETLAPYAKIFTKKKGKDDANKSQQAQITVENMWQSIQDMLADEFIGSKVYFVLNNLHALPAESDSTIKLMKLITGELEGMHVKDSKRVPTRWFITSRESHNIDEALKVDGVRLIDLEDSRYETQVQLELRKHAKKMISAIGEQKKYNKALAYFASSLVGKRAQNTQWIDITCIQLGELSNNESDLRVRQILENMPQDLKTLLDHAWHQIFRLSEVHVEKIKEMLRALVLTYEDPTESELGMLAGLASSDQEKGELRKLIEQCKPLLHLKRASKSDSVVCFGNIIVKTHLCENAKTLLGLSDEEIKWQHGVLALRCFSHIKDSLDFPTPEPTSEENIAGDAAEADNDNAGEQEDVEQVDDQYDDVNDIEQVNDESEEEDEYSESDEMYEAEEEEEDEEDDPEIELVRDKALAYTVKHWLHHASKATLEIAEDLSLEDDFWNPDSTIRRRWMIEYARMTTTFDDFDYKTLTGLHVAASIGFRQLVSALIRNGHEAEIQQRDSLVNTPLHFAAYLGRPNIVEELLNRGAVIDDAIEIHEQTPLHMAAFGGHIQVMKKLLLRGANPNAVANDIGPVVNAAISSGSREAVELLVEHDVSLTFDSNDEDISCPLALAALLADYSMFEYLIESYADKLPADDYSAALVGAAAAGRIEVFNKLLSFRHDSTVFQSALDVAVQEWNWDIVKSLLDNNQGLDVNDLFTEAATCSEPQDKMLELAWEYANGSITQETLSNALYNATDREKTHTVSLLLQKFGANPNATGDEYGTALTAAAFDGIMEMVQLLLDAGANINDPNGWALQTAAAEGHYEIVQELISRGADVNACTHNDNFAAGTALQGACESGKADMVSLLLEKGANPNIGLGTDSPPILAASQRGEAHILEMLVNAKADVDVFGGHDSSTPLINAAAYLPKESLQALLNAGADINLPDNDGDTALIVAAARGDVEAVTFLLDNGADIMHSSKRNMNALQTAFAATQQYDNQELAEFVNSSNGQWECLNVLVDRVSVLLSTLKTALDSGNVALESVIRTANISKQGLAYEDEHTNTSDVIASTENAVHSNDEDANMNSHQLTVDSNPDGIAINNSGDTETSSVMPSSLMSPDMEKSISLEASPSHFISQHPQPPLPAVSDYTVSSFEQASSLLIQENTGFVSKRESIAPTKGATSIPAAVPAPLEIIRRKPAPQLPPLGDGAHYFQVPTQQAIGFHNSAIQPSQNLAASGTDALEHQPYLPISQPSQMDHSTQQFVAYTAEQRIPQQYAQCHNMTSYNNPNRGDASQGHSVKRYSAYDGSSTTQYNGSGYSVQTAQSQLQQQVSDRTQQSYQSHQYSNYYGQSQQ